MKRLIQAAGLAVAAGAGCFAYGCLVENNRFALRRYTLPILPPGSRHVRILHVSDIHLMPYNHRRRRWIAGLAALEPDLVIDTGDNHSSAAGDAPLLAALGRLLDKPGAFVWGSNDYTGPALKSPLSYFGQGARHIETAELPWQELKRSFEEHGWEDLTHRRVRMEIKGVRLELRGVDDAHENRDSYDLVAGARPDDVDVALGVMHAPYLRTLDAMTADGVDVLLAGHTHGGQVCVPGYGALVTNCDIDRERVRGLSHHEHGGRRAWLEVSAGLGTSPFAPYRFACRPEASLLTLVPRAE